MATNRNPFSTQNQGALLWTDVINTKLKELKEKRRKHNRRIILFFFLCVACYGAACGCSVLSAALDSDKLKAAIEKENAASRIGAKKPTTEAPSPILIGVINFLGRILTAAGTLFLVQIVTSCLKRKKYDEMIKSAVEETTETVGETNVGCVDTCVECCMSFV